MNKQLIASQATAGPRINFIASLSVLENYNLPTNDTLSVEEVINRKIYAWYLQEKQDTSLLLDDAGWFLNYE
jgi:hypothetical protein